MRELYYKICNKIGYVAIVMDRYNTQTWAVEKTNADFVIFKYTSKRDIRGYRNLKQLFKIKIR